MNPPVLSPEAVRRRHALLGARARRLARPRQAPQHVAAVPSLVCEAEGALYGVPLATALRVAPAHGLAPVPTSNPALVGVFGHAARFFHVYDLAVLSGGKPTQGGTLILLRDGPHPIAIRLARVLRVADLVILAPEAASGMQPTHAPVSGFARPAEDILEGRIVAMINPRKLWSDASDRSVEGDARVDQ